MQLIAEEVELEEKRLVLKVACHKHESNHACDYGRSQVHDENCCFKALQTNAAGPVTWDNVEDLECDECIRQLEDLMFDQLISFRTKVRLGSLCCESLS